MIVFIRILIILLGFGSVAIPANAQIFEGEIAYKVDVNYKGTNRRHKEYYENEKFGDTILVYVSKEGSVRREFPGSSKYGAKYYLYDPISNIQYAEFRFSDTVYWYKADTNPLMDYKIVEGCDNNEIYFEDKLLDCIETEGFDSHLNQPTKSRYYYSPGELLFNYESWSKNKDFLQGELYGTSKSNFLIMYLDYGNYEYTMTAIDVKEMDLDDKIFKIPKGKPLKLQ